MKKLLGGLLSVVLALCAPMVRAESPFTVTPRVEVQNGARVLKVAFAVPTNHVLYAEKLAFRLADNETPGCLPIAGVKNDSGSVQRQGKTGVCAIVRGKLPAGRIAEERPQIDRSLPRVRPGKLFLPGRSELSRSPPPARSRGWMSRPRKRIPRRAPDGRQPPRVSRSPTAGVATSMRKSSWASWTKPRPAMPRRKWCRPGADSGACC